MKFSCERCGKKYATAENPAPGKVYKLKCKACGHLIVVRAAAATSGAAVRSAATPPAAPAERPQPAEAHEPAALAPSPAPDLPALDEPAHAPPGPPPLPAPRPAPEPTSDVTFDVAPPEPAQAPGNGAPTGEPQRFDASATTEVAMPSAATTPPEAAPLDFEPGPPPVEEGPPPPPGESGYVDLFSDVATGETAARGDDPFLAAARASLPDGYGETPGAPDPFAALHEEPPPADDAAPAVTPALPKVPVIPKPPKQEKSALPTILIAGGVVMLVGILAFVMLSPSKRAPPPAPAPSAPRAQAPAPPPPPLAAPAPETAATEAPAPAAPTPAPEPAKPSAGDERSARDERRRKEREAAAARAEQAKAEKDSRARAEREAREAKEREARERERRERERVAAATASSEPAEGALSQAQIEATLRSTKPAFDACLQSARGSDVKLDGRRVMMRLNIQESGTVTYPTLDDVTLNGTELGSCLKSAARLMVFPKFKGDTLHVEVPLVVR